MNKDGILHDTEKTSAGTGEGSAVGWGSAHSSAAVAPETLTGGTCQKQGPSPPIKTLCFISQ